MVSSSYLDYSIKIALIKMKQKLTGMSVLADGLDGAAPVGVPAYRMSCDYQHVAIKISYD